MAGPATSTCISSKVRHSQPIERNTWLAAFCTLLLKVWWSVWISSRVGRARAQVEDGFGAGEIERLDGTRAPVSIETGAQHTVEQIVAASDRVEHAGDARRVLRWRDLCQCQG